LQKQKFILALTITIEGKYGLALHPIFKKKKVKLLRRVILLNADFFFSL